MKKFGILVLAVVAFIVTGCGCEKTKYTVTFDSNGGSVIAEEVVLKNETVTKPTDPTKEGYTFDGWYLDGVKYNFGTEVTSNVTLVAKWTKVEVETPIEPEEPETPTEPEEPSTPTTPNKPSTPTKPSTPSTPSKPSTPTTPSTPTVTKYTVTFDTAGGSTVASQSIENGKVATKPANPTKEGCTFDGWYLGSSKYDFNTKVTSNITLKASWVSYKIENVQNSIMNQIRIFVIKDGVKVAGTVDTTNEAGVAKTIDIPATGKVVIEGLYKTIGNAKVK